jgi:hypothetical protein
MTSEELRAAVADSANLPRQPVGRYLVSFKADRDTNGGTRLVISVRIIVERDNLHSPIGGRVVPSNGSLEKQHLASVMQTLQNLR